MAEGLQSFLDNVSGVDSSDEKSMLRALRNNQSNSYESRSAVQQNTLRSNHHNSTSSNVGGVNLANVSYSDAGGQLLQGEPSIEQDRQITVGEICVPLKDVFYITDKVLLNKQLAGKLVKCNLEGSSIMVRASKDKQFDSSEQIQIG